MVDNAEFERSPVAVFPEEETEWIRRGSTRSTDRRMQDFSTGRTVKPDARITAHVFLVKYMLDRKTLPDHVSQVRPHFPMRAHTLVSSLLPVAIGLLLFAGCSLVGDDDSSVPQVSPPLDFSRFSQAPPLLVGRWEWERSTVYGPGEPGVSTPSSTGRTETLVFPSPPDSVRVYRSDTLARRTAREAFFERTSWGVHDDTLATSTVFRDGPQKVYERVE